MMRGGIGRRLSNPNYGFILSSTLKQTSHFSSDSAGRGRGRGSLSPVAGNGQFGINSGPERAKEPVAGSSESQSYGYGRGRPMQYDLNPPPPPFSPFVRPDSFSFVGRGRGGSFGSDQPHVFEKLHDIKEPTLPPQPPESNNISNALGSNAGRVQPPKDETPRPQLSPEEAGRRARSQLSQGEAVGGRGRGRGAARGRGRGRGRRGGEAWRDGDKKEEDAEQEALCVFLGDSADGEKFAKKMGDEIMNELAESYESICERALPSTAHDALVDAYDTNLMIECEPEYLMPDFGSNPDFDEKPPMSLRECLEKVKPFIVAFEGIKDQEEWEEAIDEVLAQAPLMKDIVDHYSGPDRVTAKTQNEELDRIATTLPQIAPDSLKRFADRVALSLKSNPGWGYDKKYQFMDKLVLEVSQSYNK
ncbi:Uncharacterized protein HA466_0138050 [Hirschfeldia incana]|nr:Uncharacterized protein HA466_0138050 [Hirschfeldia incana]